MNKIEQCTCLERVATFDKRDDMSTHRCPIHKQLSTKIGVISPQTSQTNLETTLKRNLHFPTDLLDRYLLPATSLSLSLISGSTSRRSVLPHVVEHPRQACGYFGRHAPPVGSPPESGHWGGGPAWRTAAGHEITHLPRKAHTFRDHVDPC